MNGAIAERRRNIYIENTSGACFQLEIYALETSSI